jgi:hypothetical protein
MLKMDGIQLLSGSGMAQRVCRKEQKAADITRQYLPQTSMPGEQGVFCEKGSGEKEQCQGSLVY